MVQAENPARDTPRFSVRRQARIAGAFYVLNTVTSLYAFFGPKTVLSLWSGLAAAASYIVVAVLFYFIFRPVSRTLSSIAALVSIAGSLMGAALALHLLSTNFNLLVCFGFYCAVIGYLIARSRFLPGFLGVVMILAGLGYLTFLWPSFGNRLTPWNYIPGAIGEWTLTIWLLIRGVDEQRWLELSSAAKSNQCS